MSQPVPTNVPQGYTPEPIRNIQRIVLNVISDLEEMGVTTAKYARLENMAVQFYQTQLAGFKMQTLVSVNVNVDTVTRIWPFPNDYIRYTKVGYNYGGRLWTLGIDESINFSNGPMIVDGPIEVAVAPQGGYWFAGGFWNGLQTQYASGGGFNVNYYRVNEAERYIQFAEQLPPGIAVVEYLSAGRGVNGYTLVPIAYEHAFKQWLKMEYCSHNPKLIKLAEMFRERYDGSMWDTLALLGHSPQEYQDEIYRASGFKLR